jgi:hypothetical protein
MRDAQISSRKSGGWHKKALSAEGKRILTGARVE